MVPLLQFTGWEWLAFALATPVVLWAGYGFHRAAVLNARHLAATMDTLISIGTLAAWGWSVVALLALDDAHTYFEVSAVITTLIILGRYLEARAKRRSGGDPRCSAGAKGESAPRRRRGLDRSRSFGPATASWCARARRLRPTAWSRRAHPRSTSRC
jgi:Cu+-exporting ATPase